MKNADTTKKPYQKPTIRVEGDVEKITLKRFGSGDAFMLSGHGAGQGSSNAS